MRIDPCAECGEHVNINSDHAPGCPKRQTPAMTTEPDYVEARPIQGYLGHAIANQPEFLHQSMPGVVITYRRALCGVGRGGMRVQLEEDRVTPRPWKGIDGCDRCHTRLHKIRQKEAGN